MRIATILFMALCLSSYAQPNCQAFLYKGDTIKYKACIEAEKSDKYYQFAKEFQQILDQALSIDPTFAYAYREKSTAYLKSGDFITWKQLIDKAVEYDPEGQLGYRGWCRYQFFRDYKGAIRDIELLDNLVDYDIGNSINGDYHLHIARALCYKAIGNSDTAIHIIENQLADSNYFVGLYDYLHLGVLYLEKGKYENAINALNQQQTYNDIAENQYYLALALKAQGNMDGYIMHLQSAQNKYLQEYRMFDPYTEMADKIYMKDIDKELKQADIQANP